VIDTIVDVDTPDFASAPNGNLFQSSSDPLPSAAIPAEDAIIGIYTPDCTVITNGNLFEAATLLFPAWTIPAVNTIIGANAPDLISVAHIKLFDPATLFSPAATAAFKHPVARIDTPDRAMISNRHMFQTTILALPVNGTAAVRRAIIIVSPAFTAIQLGRMVLKLSGRRAHAIITAPATVTPVIDMPLGTAKAAGKTP